MKENKSTHWSIRCKVAQWRYNTQIHHTLWDSPYHLNFGQQPHFGISNLPILSEILNNLVNKAELIDIYSNMKLRMMTNLPQALDPAYQGTLSTVTKSVNDGIAAIADTTPTTMTDIATPAAHKRDYTSSQDHCNAKRATTLILRTSVIGNGVAVTSAQDIITTLWKTPKGKKGDVDVDVDITKVCWIELLGDRDPTKPDELLELKSARIGTVFPIIHCINNEDITTMENWESCILKKVRKETWEVLNVHKNDKVEDDIKLEGDDDLKNTWGLYYKSPGNEYVTLYVTATKKEQFDTEKQDVLPKHASLCAKATANIQKKAEAITKKALKKSPTSSLKLGDIILVPLNEVDCSKVNRGNLAGVIVSINKDKSTFWVAVKQGLLHQAYVFHSLSLRVVFKALNNRRSWTSKMLSLFGRGYQNSPKEKLLITYRQLEVREW
jgi:hypothetical protein